MDAVFPVRQCPASKIYAALANGLPCVGVELVDCILMGGPHGTSCQRGLDIRVSMCAELGVPHAAHKQEGPCT